MKPSRRQMLRQSTAVLTAAAVASSVGPGAFAAENNTINIALVGCGGRGTGAAGQALSTSGPTRLVAMADLFPDRLEGSLKNLTTKFAAKIEVPPERRFLGFDAFKKAIDFLGKDDIVLLTTPPCFRGIHLEYAVEKGRNVFMEKSFGTDAPNARRVLAAGQKAQQKNLKIGGGLMSRHNPRLEELMQRIQGGEIGDIITAWAYRMHAPVGFRPRKPPMTEVEHQIRNYNNFTWVSGSFILDWMIHDLDVCCWAKGAWPVSAQASAGRQMRIEQDQLFDHMGIEYRFPDGTRMFAQGRHMNKCWGYFADVIHGTKGTAYLGVVGDGSVRPKTYKGWNQTKENVIWEGKQPGDPYQIEHDHLQDAVRNNKPYNESERCVQACMTSIMGRMAMESGQEVTWETAFNSKLELAPGLESLTLDSPPPVKADEKGNYPVAQPGVSKAF